MNKNMIELIELLERDPIMRAIFKQCPFEVLQKIRVMHYGKKDFYLEQDEIHDTFYILVKGKVDIFLESVHGKKYFLTTYGKGRFIGEMELFQRAPYVSSVESVEPITVLEIDRDVFQHWVKLDQNFNEYLIKSLCTSSYTMCKNMGENTLYSLKYRVCQYFLEQIDQNGMFSRIEHIESLGEQLAVTQRSVNRILQSMKEKGIIESDRSGVIVKDYEALVREKEKEERRGM